jgi:heme exporter protein A
VSARAPAVALHGVARRFGRRWVLRGADLTVQHGESVALMGKNGSGKTTLLRVIATLLKPSRGSGQVLGFDLLEDAPQVREQVGLLGHHSGLYDDLTASENLRFSLRMSGQPYDARLVEPVLEQVGLQEHGLERVRGFSAGMRRRLALARLFLRQPRLLLLDEPYAAFDQSGVDLVNQYARDVSRRGGAVIVVTHDIARARAAVDRVQRIEEGRIVHGQGSNLSPDDHEVAGELA